MMENTFLIDFQRFGEALEATLGVKLRDPIPVSLGYIDENGVKHLKVGAGEDSQRYYYSGAPGTEITPGEAVNAGSTPIPNQFLHFGAKVYVRQDELDPKVYYLAGLQPTPTNLSTIAAQLPQPEPIYLHQIIPGLLDQTDPPSMRCRVMGAPYTMASSFKKIETKLTIEFTGNVPATPGKAVYVRVGLNFDTEELDYAFGAEIDANLSDSQSFAIDGGSGVYLPHTPGYMFRCGFVKLIHGMTEIRRINHIFAAHEILNRTDYRDVLTAADEVVTCDGEVLYV